MRIFDACCGLGPWRTRDPLHPATPQELLTVLDQFAIDAALVYGKLAASGGLAADGNAIVQQAAADNPRFVPAYVLDISPHRRGALPETFAALREAGVRAVWLLPPWNINPSAWVYDDLFAHCARARLPLFLSTNSFHPDTIDLICTAFPELRVVVTGTDYRSDDWLYPLLRRHPACHACCALTYILPRGVERFVAAFGPERLLFGSGLPEFSPGGLIGYIQYAEINEADKAAIFAGNLDRLLAEAWS